MSRPLHLSMHSTQTLPCGRLPSVMRNSRVGQRQGLVHQHVPFKFSAPSIVAEDALCRFWSLLGHLVALTMLEAKSVFCIRRLCFSVVILAMLSWNQPTQRYTRQSNAFVRLTAEATSAILPNTSVFPAQATAAEAILLRCVLLLVSYLGGSMSIFSIYTKKKTNPNMLMGYAGPCGSHVMLLTLKPSLRRHRKQISAAMWSGSIWAPREACSRGHPFLCCVLLVKTFIAQYLYICIYTHLYVCFFNLPAEKRTLDSRCTTLAWTSCLDIRSCCNNNFFNFFRPFPSFCLSMSPLKLSMHSTQTLPCGRLPSVMRNSRVGQRQGVVHQHVPFKFSAPTIVAEDALCRFWSLLGHLVALTMLLFRPYCGGYLCHVAEYFCFPSAINCSRGHSIALCAAVGVIFGWVYVYFQYLYEKKTNPNMLMGYAGPCGSHVMLLTLKPSLRRHRKQISAAMWCRIHLSPPRSLQPRPSFSMLRVVGKDLHCTIFVHICIYIHICMYVFLIFPAEKRTLDSRCTTLAWTSCLDIRSCCNNNFFNFFRPFHPFPCQWAVLYTCPCILPRLCHVVGCRQSWGTAGWDRGKDLCTSMFHLSFLLPPS